jgi:hypothetical protein
MLFELGNVTRYQPSKIKLGRVVTAGGKYKCFELPWTWECHFRGDHELKEMDQAPRIVLPFFSAAWSIPLALKIILEAPFPLLLSSPSNPYVCLDS